MGSERGLAADAGGGVRVSGEGWVLLGDAAHLVHRWPARASTSGSLTSHASHACWPRESPGGSLGDARLLRRFAPESVANLAMGQFTDALQRLFASDAGLVREARNRGLTALNHLHL